MEILKKTGLYTTLLLLIAVKHSHSQAFHNNRDDDNDNDDVRTAVICQSNRRLNCGRNEILQIEDISVMKISDECASVLDTTCITQLPKSLAEDCNNKPQCEVDWGPIRRLFPGARFACPPRRGGSSSANARSTHEIRVTYECKRTSEDWVIKENQTETRRLEEDTTQRISSPSQMSSDSQNIFCVFTRIRERITTRTTRVNVKIVDLQLDGAPRAQNLTFKSDSGMQGAYGSPITINGRVADSQRTIRFENVENNFTMHFNQCRTLAPGGRFMIDFEVESDFEGECVHTFTQCELLAPPPAAGPDPDEGHSAEDHDKIAIIVGGVIGGLVLLVILLVIIICILLSYIRKRRQTRNISIRRPRPQPPVSMPRYSSHIYDDIKDPRNTLYTEIGRVNTICEKKAPDVADRPAHPIPRTNGIPPQATGGASNLDYGYDKIRESELRDAPNNAFGEKSGNYYAKINAVTEDATATEDPDGSDINSYSKLVLSENDPSVEPNKENYTQLETSGGGEYDKLESPTTNTDKYEYTLPNKGDTDNKVTGKNEDEGIEVEPREIDLRRLDSEVVMEDNVDLYISADEAENNDKGITRGDSAV